MSILPEVASRIATKIAAMNIYERAARAAELIDDPLPSEEDELEFVKLVCGLPADVDDVIRRLTARK